MAHQRTAVGLQLGEEVPVLGVGAVGGGSVDSHLGRGRGGVFQSGGRLLPKLDEGHVVRIVAVTEAVADVAQVEVHVHQAVVTIYHVAVLLPVYLEDEPVLAVLHAGLGHQAEHFRRLVVVHRLGFGVAGTGLQLQAGEARFAGGVNRFVPLPAAGQVLLLHLLQRGQLGNVGHDQLDVGVTVLLAGGNVLPREVV